MADLPATNNDLEHLFGVLRCQERRVTGQKAASAHLVVRGPVRLLTAVTARTTTFTAEQLRPPSPAAWRELRAAIDQRQTARRAQLRFRRDPDAYLAAAEAALLPSGLPP